MGDSIKIEDNSACYRYTKNEMAYTSITTALIYACLRHIHGNGCNEISREGYDRIKDGAAFLVESGQVRNAEDITLGAILECFNDTDIDRYYI